VCRAAYHREKAQVCKGDLLSRREVTKFASLPISLLEVCSLKPCERASESSKRNRDARPHLVSLLETTRPPTDHSRASLEDANTSCVSRMPLALVIKLSNLGIATFACLPEGSRQSRVRARWTCP
jgi:hypothetical protein